jgi:hypothetical protein
MTFEFEIVRMFLLKQNESLILDKKCELRVELGIE